MLNVMDFVNGPAQYSPYQEAGVELIKKPDCANISSKGNKSIKKEKTMSFVGIICNQHGMVAFGDTKLTYADGRNQEYAAVNNEKIIEVQKVFRSNNLLITSFGLATIGGHFHKRRNVEDAVNEIIENNPDITINDFPSEFQKKITGNGTYRFIFGYRDDKPMEMTDSGYEIVEYEISKHRKESIATIHGGLITNNSPVNNEYICVNENAGIPQLAENAVALENAVYLLYENFMAYNPVGGHINIMTLPDEKESLNETLSFTA